MAGCGELAQNVVKGVPREEGQEGDRESAQGCAQRRRGRKGTQRVHRGFLLHVHSTEPPRQRIQTEHPLGKAGVFIMGPEVSQSLPVLVP